MRELFTKETSLAVGHATLTDGSYELPTMLKSLSPTSCHNNQRHVADWEVSTG